MNLKNKTITNLSEEMETNLGIKRFYWSKEDISAMLLNQVNEMKK